MLLGVSIVYPQLQAMTATRLWGGYGESMPGGSGALHASPATCVGIRRIYAVSERLEGEGIRNDQRIGNLSHFSVCLVRYQDLVLISERTDKI